MPSVSSLDFLLASTLSSIENENLSAGRTANSDADALALPPLNQLIT